MRWLALFALLTGCSSTTIIYVVPEGGSDAAADASYDVAVDQFVEASQDAAADAGDAGCPDISALPNFSKQDDCAYIDKSQWNPQVPYCPSCAPQYAYSCNSQTQPKIQGCVKYDINPNSAPYYCCPTVECHRFAEDDALCGDGGVFKTIYAFACPMGKMPPQNYCMKVSTFSGDDILCCSQQ